MPFAGYLDGAIRFAETGGDGGGSDLPWGRDPNEDDRKFALRGTGSSNEMKPVPESI